MFTIRGKVVCEHFPGFAHACSGDPKTGHVRFSNGCKVKFKIARLAYIKNIFLYKMV